MRCKEAIGDEIHKVAEKEKRRGVTAVAEIGAPRRRRRRRTVHGARRARRRRRRSDRVAAATESTARKGRGEGSEEEGECEEQG